jgi:hypothetical protein
MRGPLSVEGREENNLERRKRRLSVLLLAAVVLVATLAVAPAASAWTVTMNANPSLKRTYHWAIEKSVSQSSLKGPVSRAFLSRDGRIRTGGLLLPKQARYQAAPRPAALRAQCRAAGGGPQWRGRLRR